MVLLLLAAGGAYAKGRVSGYNNYGAYGLDDCLYQWEIGDKTDGSDTRALGTVCLTNADVFGYSPQLHTSGAIAMLSDRRVLLSHRNATNTQSVSVLQCLYDSSGLLTNCAVNWTATESGQPIAPLPNGAFACHRGSTIAIYKQTGTNTWTVDTIGAAPDSTPKGMAGLITAATNEVATSSGTRDAYRIRPSGWAAKYNGGGVTHPWWDGADCEGLRHDLLANGWLVGYAVYFGSTNSTEVMDGTESGGGTYNGVKGKLLNAGGTDVVSGIVNGKVQWAALNDGRVVHPGNWGFQQAGLTWEVYTLVQSPSNQPAGAIGATGYTFTKYTPGNFVGPVVGDYLFSQGTPTVKTAGGATGVTDTAAWLVGSLVSTGSCSTSWGLCWGTADRGNTTTGWSGGFINWGAAGGAPATNSQQVNGLAGSATYYYRVFATNAAGAAWSAVSSFTTFGAPVVNNGAGVTSLGSTSATLCGQLVRGNPNPNVWIYWGTTDGGTAKGAWDMTPIGLGAPGMGGFAFTQSGLAANRPYWYRCYASNSWGEAWAPASTNFTTPSGAPAVANQTPTGVGAGAASLNGRLVSTGSAPVTAVAVYWGPTDGGTNASLWANTNVLSGGPWNQGDALTTSVSTLCISRDYFYTCYAENACGGAWATPSVNFAAGGLYWIQRSELTASDGAASSYFGNSVSLSGNRAVVGAYNYANGKGVAYVYDWDGANWTQSAKLTASDGVAGDGFGCSVSLDGNRAVVGAYGKTNDQGAAYVYEGNGTNWAQTAKLTASDGAAYDFFGYSVSLNGNRVAVGAYRPSSQKGAAYVYDRSGTNWAQTARLNASDGVPNDYFGYSVSLEGNRIVVGACLAAAQKGAAYVYDWGGTNWVQSAELTASDGAPSSYFGDAVSLNGNRVVVGAYYGANYQGAAYVYDFNAPNWKQSAELIAADGSTYDYFGSSVSVSGNRVVVGAYGKANDQGAAYVYEGNGTNWVRSAALTASDGAAYDYLGCSVSLNGDRTVVGAYGKASYQGAAYVYDLSVQRNTAPTANTQSMAVILGASQTPVDLFYADPDPGQSFSFQLVTAPSRGTVQYSSKGSLTTLPTHSWVNGGRWYYTPSGTTAGTDRFSWMVSDGMTNSGPATVSVNIVMPAAPGTPPLFKAGVLLMDGTNVLSVWRQVNGAKYVYANAKIVGGAAMAAPELVDWNNDGLTDLLIGQTDGRIALFINQGTKGNPLFHGYTYLKSLDGSDIRLPRVGCSCFGGSSAYAAPRLVDWNSDGKRDLIIGAWHGDDWAHGMPKLFLYVFLNIGTDDAPVFDRGTTCSCPFTSTIADTGFSGGRPTSMPCVTDMNGDGILDVIAGENNIWFSTAGMYGGAGAPSGLINIYLGTRNDHTDPTSFVGGTASAIPPTLTVAGACPAQSRKSVVAVDWTGSGKKDLVTGMQDGTVWYSPNIGTPQIPVFTNGYRLQAGGAPIVVGNTNWVGQDPGWANAPSDRHGSDFLNYGNEARIAVADLDGDGLPDLVVGDVNGHVTFFPQYNPDPAAVDQRLMVMRNAAKSVTLAARVDSGRAVTFSVLTPPEHGSLSGAAPNLVYTPTADYTGPDHFTFQAADPSGASGQVARLSRTGTIFISVRNHAPVAQDQATAVATMNTPRTIILRATDAGDDPLTYSLAVLPAHGACLLSSNRVTYTPSTNYTGQDRFTWKANDGYLDSNMATVSVDVAVLAVNFQPPAYPVPAGYVKDEGSAFNAGRGYGWDTTRTNQVNCLNLNPDPRVDTRIAATSNATWTCALPNGDYAVTLAYGNPDEAIYVAFQDCIAMQGVTVVNNPANNIYASNPMFGSVGNLPVTVTNGQLTVVIGNNTNSAPTRLDYLEIRDAYRPMGWATFVAQDNVTRGNWQGVYGTEGYWIPDTFNYNVQLMSALSLPVYATLNGPICTNAYAGCAVTWADPSSDSRALQHLGSATRIQSAYYVSVDGSTLWWDLTFVDGLTHRVAMYFVDWWGGRAETADILDANDNTVLDTRTLTGFTGGTYLVWDAGGHVTIRLTGTTGYPVFSGLFFGGGSDQDFNQDGLPDGWQINYFGSIASPLAAPWADPSGDGMNNLQKYLAGLDPTKPESLLKVFGLDAGGGTNFIIRWPSAQGRFYSIDASTNLNEGFPAVVGAGLPATPAMNCATVNVNQANQRFFRVRVE